MSDRGLNRDPKDGILYWRGGRNYLEPEEAIKTYHKGELRLGCNERMYRDYSASPCGNKPKYDPDENGNFTKCGHHCKAAKDRKKAKREAQMEQWRKEWDYSDKHRAIMDEMPEIIKKIAEGHNDPRTLCADWMKRKQELEEGKP